MIFHLNNRLYTFRIDCQTCLLASFNHPNSNHFWSRHTSTSTVYKCTEFAIAYKLFFLFRIFRLVVFLSFLVIIKCDAWVFYRLPAYLPASVHMPRYIPVMMKRMKKEKDREKTQQQHQQRSMYTWVTAYWKQYQLITKKNENIKVTRSFVFAVPYVCECVWLYGSFLICFFFSSSTSFEEKAYDRCCCCASFCIEATFYVRNAYHTAYINKMCVHKPSRMKRTKWQK